MATIKDSFQKEIKYKLNQKATSNISEETILLKAFKYFDLNNTQCIDKETFLKVIEKIGIIIFNKEDFFDLFYYYSEGQEKLNYYQFNQQLFGFKAGTTRKFLHQQNQQQKQQESGVDNLFEKLQNELCQRGPSGILSLGIVFKSMDVYNSSQHIIDFQDLFQCFQELKLSSLNQQELQLLFNFFDDRKIGLLNYDQFLQKLLAKLQKFSALRHQIIQKIFSSILIKENSNQEIIQLEKLINYFKPQNHPDVKKNIISIELIKNDFERTIKDYYLLRGQGDGCISMEEFEEYYKFTSFYIQNDDDFGNIVESVWGEAQELVQPQQLQQTQQLSQNQQVQSQSLPQQFQQSEQKSIYSYDEQQSQQSVPVIQKQKLTNQSKQQAFYSRASFDKIRSKLLQRGVKGLLGIQYSFKLGDIDKDQRLTYKEFNDILQLFNILIEEDEKQSIFSELDPDKTGIMRIDQLVQQIRGEMNNFRRSIILRIFRELDRNQLGFLQLSEIKTLYNPVNHPQVLNGSKTQNDIVNEFIETFEQHHQLFNTKRNTTTVTLQQFIDYYQNLSATIPNDQYFELLALNSFKMFSKPSQQSSQSEIIAAGQRTHQDMPNQFGATPNKVSKTIMNAPFGTSNIQTDYSTQLRPQSQQKQQQLQSQEFLGRNAAGAPSWPGLNQFYTPQEISYLQAQGEIQATQQSFQQPSQITLPSFFDQLKKKLTARGFKAGILNFLRQIQRSSNPQTNTITFDQFVNVLQNLRLNDFSEIALQSIVEQLAQNAQNLQEGVIEADRITELVNCQLNQRQKDAVLFVFNKLDRTGNGTITLDDVRFNFNPRGHPDIAAGKKTEDEVLGDFLDTFEQSHAIFWNDPKLRNQTVTVEEFINYYANLSTTVSDEERFIQMVVQTWELE